MLVKRVMLLITEFGSNASCFRHEFVGIDLKNKPDWFLQKSPSGKVPMLEFDNKLLYESDVCCDYLDDAHAQNKLVPDDPYLRAKLKLQRVPFNDVSFDCYTVLN